jgi:hypothetical protein
MLKRNLLCCAGALLGALALSLPARAADPVAAPAAPAAGQAETGAMPEGHPSLPEGHPAMPEGHPGVTLHPGEMPTPHPPTAAEQAEAAHQGIDVTASTKSGTTVIPDAVKGKWKAATFVVVDRQQSKAQEVTVDLKGEWPFPGSDLKLRVLEFLPDLRIDNKIYTSASNEPNNPAAHVVIYQGDKEIFDGWLFSQFPQVHKFDHPRFGITLKEGVPT